METPSTETTVVAEKQKRFVSEVTRQKMRLAKLGKKRGPYQKRNRVTTESVTNA